MHLNIINYFSRFFSDNSRKTLKFRILFAFGLFFITTVALIILTVWFDREENQIDRIIANLHKINLKVKEINSLEKDFISYEAINSEFYTTDESIYITKHKEMLQHLKTDLDILQRNGHYISNDIDKQVDSVKQVLDIYETTFDSLVYFIKMRGFQDYGLEDRKSVV